MEVIIVEAERHLPCSYRRILTLTNSFAEDSYSASSIGCVGVSRLEVLDHLQRPYLAFLPLQLVRPSGASLAIVTFQAPGSTSIMGWPIHQH